MILPNKIFSGAYREGHVQGIAIDVLRGYVYYSFTTMLLKTDLSGNPVGSVVHLAGHLGCITYDVERNRLYASLEMKHDAIGAGIIKRTGWNPTEEDAFYLVSFDCDSITHMNMDAECEDVMRAVYLADVARDYCSLDTHSQRPHRYGCSGIDGVGIGPVYGSLPNSPKKIMVAYGIYSELDREDNDYQVILQYDPDVIDAYGARLCQATPHHSGPDTCEARYFFYTGNTVYGVQNLEYDPYSHTWFLAVYTGKKPQFEPFRMFFIDGGVAPADARLIGRGEERGRVLQTAALGRAGKQACIRGCDFPYGQTGIASLGNGIFCFSQDGGNKEDKSFWTTVVQYRIDPDREELFVKLSVDQALSF